MDVRTHMRWQIKELVTSVIRTVKRQKRAKHNKANKSVEKLEKNKIKNGKGKQPQPLAQIQKTGKISEIKIGERGPVALRNFHSFEEGRQKNDRTYSKSILQRNQYWSKDVDEDIVNRVRVVALEQFKFKKKQDGSNRWVSSVFGFIKASMTGKKRKSLNAKVSRHL